MFTLGEITGGPQTGRPVEPAVRLREFVQLATLADQAGLDLAGGKRHSNAHEVMADVARAGRRLREAIPEVYAARAAMHLVTVEGTIVELSRKHSPTGQRMLMRPFPGGTTNHGSVGSHGARRCSSSAYSAVAPAQNDALSVSDACPDSAGLDPGRNHVKLAAKAAAVCATTVAALALAVPANADQASSPCTYTLTAASIAGSCNNGAETFSGSVSGSTATGDFTMNSVWGSTTGHFDATLTGTHLAGTYTITTQGGTRTGSFTATQG